MRFFDDLVLAYFFGPPCIVESVDSKLKRCDRCVWYRDELGGGGATWEVDSAERHAADRHLFDVGRRQKIAELSLSPNQVVKTTHCFVRRFGRAQTKNARAAIVTQPQLDMHCIYDRCNACPTPKSMHWIWIGLGGMTVTSF